MANSVVTATGDGVTVQYTLNFTLGILRRDYVTCRVGSEVDGAGDPVYRTLEWVSDSIVNIQGTVPANGESIVFTRTVPKNLLIHDYSNGVPVEESNLDESNLQTIMAVHEFLDGRVEGGFLQDIQMNGYKILNLGDGTADTDAANMRQLNETITAANAAVASTAADVTTCTTKASEASASATESEDWATKTDGIVESTDYSSKAFAIGGTGVTDTAGRGAAKEWATKAEDSTVDGTEYSAKHYSAKASASASSAAASASSAAASAVAVSLPSITATDTGALLQVNADGTTHQLLQAGTAGKFLMSNGPDALLTYEDVPAPNRALLDTRVLSSDAQVDFGSSLITSTYDLYRIIGVNVKPAVDNASLHLRHFVSGVIDTGWNYHYDYEDRNGGTSFNGSNAIELNSPHVDTSYGCSFIIDIIDPTNSGRTHSFCQLHMYDPASAGSRYSIGGGGDVNARALDGLRLYFDNGNLASGTLYLEGYKL